MRRWLINVGLASATLMSSAVFLLVNTGCIFLPRSDSCLRTTSADCWSLNSRIIRTGALAWTSPTCGWFRDSMNLVIVELIRFSGYFSLRRSLSSCHTRQRIDEVRMIDSGLGSTWLLVGIVCNEHQQRILWNEIWMLNLRNALYPTKKTRLSWTLNQTQSKQNYLVSNYCPQPLRSTF